MEWYFWPLLTSVLSGAIGIYYLCLKQWNYFKKNGILHIPPLPIIGNMAVPLLRRKALAEHLNDLYYLNEDAKYIGFYEFSIPMIMIRDVELIKSVTMKNFDHFTDHLGLIDANLDPLFGNMLFAIRGDKWRELRSQLSAVHTSSKLKTLFHQTNNYAKNFVDHLVTRCSEGPYIIDVKDAFTRFCSDIGAFSIFGVTVDSMKDPKNDFYMLGQRATAIDSSASVKFILARNFPLFARLMGLTITTKKVRQFFSDLVKDTVKFRTENGITGSDMIQLMMQVDAAKSEESHKMSNELMTELAFGFFFGGLDTGSTMQSFVAHMIAVNREVYEKVQAEVDQVMEDCDGVPTFDAIAGMPYLEAVIMETMRIYPPVSFLDRICTKDYELPSALPGSNPVRIKRGTCIWIPTYSVHRDLRNYEDPETFDPERFIGNRKASINPSKYFPFGIGPRMCTGYRFALIECKLLFCHLLYHCQLSISPKSKVSLKLSTDTLLMTAEGGFWFQLECRNKSGM